MVFRPDETVWEKGTFELSIEFTEEYPKKPPIILFKTPMFHPNSICKILISNSLYWWQDLPWHIAESVESNDEHFFCIDIYTSITKIIWLFYSLYCQILIQNHLLIQLLQNFMRWIERSILLCLTIILDIIELQDNMLREVGFLLRMWFQQHLMKWSNNIYFCINYMFIFNF